MKVTKYINLILILSLLALAGCEDIFGSKHDPTTDDIFREGRIDPRLITDIGYVPILPFFEASAAGPLDEPRDVYVGYDGFVYVVDNNGLHVLDRSGRPANLNFTFNGQSLPYIALDRAGSVIQDRRLHVYVTARRDTVVAGTNWNLAVIYRFSGLSTGNPQLEDIIWHPFDDMSRQIFRSNPLASLGDGEAEFTGVAVLHDNRILVSRRGPYHDPRSPTLPHNIVLEFNPNGRNTHSVLALSPVSPSLRSAVNPSHVLSYIHPPQRATFSRNDDFIIAQSRPEDPLRYGVLAIRTVATPDGLDYRPDTDKLAAALEGDAPGYMYDEFRFVNPSGMAFAADGRNFIFVVDAGKDSLFHFSSRGVDGITPPPGAPDRSPVQVSFGGRGDGPMQFQSPEGVAYYSRMVYVADTGNNRISRFRLNTDLE